MSVEERRARQMEELGITDEGIERDTATSDKIEEARQLTMLLRELQDSHVDTGVYLTLVRWPEGECDVELAELIRSLARAALDGISLDDVGRATLAEIDKAREGAESSP